MDNIGSFERSIPLSLAPPSSYNVLRFSAASNASEQNRCPLGSSQAFNIAPFAGFDDEQLLTAPYKQQRKIPKVPFKVLDAPAL